MPVSKLKNLILLILALSVACLLGVVVPERVAQARAEETLHAQLEELFAAYDIRLDGSILPRSASLYAIELGAQKQDGATAAEALLGAQAALTPDSTHYASTYSSERGVCTLRSDGGFSAELTQNTAETDFRAAAEKLLKKMGFEADTLSEPERQADGTYAVTATQCLLGVPVLSDGLSLRFSDGALTAMEGTFFTGASQLTRISEEACISCADALTALLSSRDALGWVGGQITSVRQCYRYLEAASAALRLTPVWMIETDTGVFCVSGLTREVTVWEG